MGPFTAQFSTGAEIASMARELLELRERGRRLQQTLILAPQSLESAFQYLGESSSYQ